MRGAVAKRLRKEAYRIAAERRELGEGGLVSKFAKRVKYLVKYGSGGEKISVTVDHFASRYEAGPRRIYRDLKRDYRGKL